MADELRGPSGPPAAGAPPPADPPCTPARFYAYWIFALAAAVSAFASHIYVRQRVVGLSYDLGQERAQRARLENDRRDLELELASLEAPADLAQISRDVLGLDVPRDDQILEVDAPPDARPQAAAVVAVPAGPPPDAAPPAAADMPPGVPVPPPAAPAEPRPQRPRRHRPAEPAAVAPATPAAPEPGEPAAPPIAPAASPEPAAAPATAAEVQP